MQQEHNLLPVPQQEVLSEPSLVLLLWNAEGMWFWRISTCKDGDAHRQIVARGHDADLTAASLRAERTLRKLLG